MQFTWIPKGLNFSFVWMPVANTCNLNNSGGRDQEDPALKSTQESILKDLISKKPFTRKGW
jgi:hypothetical protein